MTVFGYVRIIEDAPGELCKAERVQRGHIHFFAALHGLQVEKFLVEQSYGAETPLFQRFEGRHLAMFAKSGDIIIATGLDRVFDIDADARVTLKKWREQNIDLQLVDFGGSVTHPALASMMERLLQAA